MEFGRCYKCMAALDNEVSRICPKCGYNNAFPQQSDQALPCGSILQGRYIIGCMLGQGGFGITYIGYDWKLETAVCIKEFFPLGMAVRIPDRSGQVYWGSSKTAIPSKLQREAFVSEARKAVKVRSLSSVVNVWDVFYENETAYIIMEYIKGITVKEYLMKKGTPMDIGECLTLLVPVIRDLQKVHEIGIVHRDISPDNLMIREDGRVMLLDLGAAKDLTQGSGQSSTIVVKRGFSPFEQYSRNSSIGSWTDVYAMTATIYWCLTKEVIPEATDRIIQDTLTFPPDIPPNVATVLRHGLALKPKERIPDCRSLLEELESTVQQKTESVTRKPLNIPETSRPASENNTAKEEYRDNSSKEPQNRTRGAKAVVPQKKVEEKKKPEISRTSSAPMALTDTWRDIIAAGRDGTYKKRYRIGDTKELDMGSEGVITMKLVAMDEDELADGSGKAPMTWVADKSLRTKHKMNDKRTNKGGWEASGMRSWLRRAILPLMPIEVRYNIRAVTKYSYSYDEKKDVTTKDTIWIPSMREVFLADQRNWVKKSREKAGASYTSVFTDDESHKRSRAGESGASRWWWLRSSGCFYSFHFYYVSSNGDYSNYPADFEGGVVVGFCL